MFPSLVYTYDLRHSACETVLLRYAPEEDVTKHSRRLHVSFPKWFCHAGGGKARELFIFDDIRSDASDKSAARDLPSWGALYPFTQAYITGSIAARNSLGTRNSPLMSWRFLRSFHCDFPAASWHSPDPGMASSWHRGCNHLAELPCVKWSRILILGRPHAFVSSFRARLHARVRAEPCRPESQYWL